jgi:hypothetical protein
MTILPANNVTIITDYLNDKGISAVAITTFFQFLHPPEQLPLISQAAGHLLTILPLFSNACQVYDNTILPALTEWQSICTFLDDALHLPELEIIPPSHHRSNDPLFGYYDINPQYVTICGGFVNDRHRSACAHVMAAVYALTNRYSNDGDKLSKCSSAIHSSYRAIRNLRKERNQLELESFPGDQTITNKEVMEFLKKQTSQNMIFIRGLLSLALHLRKPVDRSARSGDSPVPPPPKKPALTRRFDEPITISASPDPDSLSPPAAINILRTPSIEASLEKQVRRSGLSPNEFKSNMEFVQVKDSDSTRKHGKSLGQKVVEKRLYADQIAFHNQSLPSRWELLTSYELNCFLDEIINLMTSKLCAHETYEKIPAPELGALLWCMFWRGLRLELACDLLLYSQETVKHGETNGFVCPSGNGKKAFWLVVPKLSEVTCDESIDSTLLVQPVKSYTLKSDQQIEAILYQYLKTSKRLSELEKIEKMFPSPIADYSPAISLLLSKINKKHRTRLTIIRISDYLFDEILTADNSDITMAMLITNKDSYVGTNPLAYTCISTSMLNEVYRMACYSILKKQKACACKDTQKALWFDIDDNYVGSTLRPTKETVIALVKQLKNELRAAKARKPSRDRTIEVHNCMAIYTTLMFAFSTGYRAVRNPLLPSLQLDFVTGFAVISDKDSEDHYNTRLIWVPKLCRLQYLLYQSHLTVLFEIMPTIPSQDYYRYRSGETPSVFLLDPEGKNLEFSPSKILPAKFKIPDNANRHYLRSSLLECHCPTEIIHSFMGHWERGQEPWSRYSGLSPVIYQKHLAKHLDQLLSEACWETIAGLGDD